MLHIGRIISIIILLPWILMVAGPIFVVAIVTDYIATTIKKLSSIVGKLFVYTSLLRRRFKIVLTNLVKRLAIFILNNISGFVGVGCEACIRRIENQSTENTLNGLTT